ncbi:MAG: hypothetical protein OXM87_07750 [Truepera sp.]|nr:hypothetical protein [Truepera sp.]
MGLPRSLRGLRFRPTALVHGLLHPAPSLLESAQEVLVGWLLLWDLPLPLAHHAGVAWWA